MASGGWFGPNAGSYSGGGGGGGSGGGGYSGDFGGGNFGFGSFGNDFGDSWSGGKGGMKGDAGKGGGKAMCKFFLQGNCTRGSSCAFSHGGDGGRSKEFCPPAGGKMPQCKFFLQGTCAKGRSCQFSHDREADEPDDPDLLEIQDAIDKVKLKKDDEDAAMMAEMDELVEEEERQPADDNESEGSDALPPPATEKEIAEAQEIVKRAQDDLIERNKMKAKVKDANKSDLQAMINARLTPDDEGAHRACFRQVNRRWLLASWLCPVSAKYSGDVATSLSKGR
eukprot:CAMPEP_0181443132 /NCGR_PEP_ID=MMETSP1110-20121109/24395_1 /TAXON_ID=174948 /ORGANISM="Symbiodinium sp., Strain CCMP421" /LENGTH=280 /DNA_ID=CAMNT_0023567097 /DNA_START=68 /DNA_END=907 /DNA_ORIENTATION=-